MNIDQESWLRGLGTRVGRELVTYDTWTPPVASQQIPTPQNYLVQQFTQQSPMRGEYSLVPTAGPRPDASVFDGRNMYERVGVPTRMVVRGTEDMIV